MLDAVGIVSAAIWAYLLLGRGGFWRMERSRGQAEVPTPQSVVAVVPARNEATVVGDAIRSLVGQKYAGEFRIVLVDDDSADGTAAVARKAAAGGELTIIPAAPLPTGWTGKLWAVAEGVRCAETWQPDYYLLTDADIVHPRDDLASLVARAEADGYDLVSYMATLECRSPAEHALIPAFVFFFFMLYPPAWVRNLQRSTAGAAGGCILIRRTMLEELGGIAAIAGNLIDDCALARAVKQRGGRVWLGLNPATRSIRGYSSFAEIGRMISRTAFTQLHYSFVQLVGTVVGLVITYLAPPLLAIGGSGLAAGLGAAAWITMSIMYLPILSYYGMPLFWMFSLPLVATFYLGATIHSAVSHWRGRGGLWKGRVGPSVAR
jgi:hopene-associated glycosyltransferase HpnB